MCVWRKIFWYHQLLLSTIKQKDFKEFIKKSRLLLGFLYNTQKKLFISEAVKTKMMMVRELPLTTTCLHDRDTNFSPLKNATKRSLWGRRDALWMFFFECFLTILTFYVSKVNVKSTGILISSQLVLLNMQKVKFGKLYSGD